VHGDPSEYSDGLRKFAAQQNILIEYSEEIAPARGTSYGGHAGFESGDIAVERKIGASLSVSGFQALEYFAVTKPRSVLQS